MKEVLHFELDPSEHERELRTLSVDGARLIRAVLSLKPDPWGLLRHQPIEMHFVFNPAWPQPELQLRTRNSDRETARLSKSGVSHDLDRALMTTDWSVSALHWSEAEQAARQVQTSLGWLDIALTGKFPGKDQVLKDVSGDWLRHWTGARRAWTTEELKRDRRPADSECRSLACWNRETLPEQGELEEHLYELLRAHLAWVVRDTLAYGLASVAAELRAAPRQGSSAFLESLRPMALTTPSRGLGAASAAHAVGTSILVLAALRGLSHPSGWSSGLMLELPMMLSGLIAISGTLPALMHASTEPRWWRRDWRALALRLSPVVLALWSGLAWSAGLQAPLIVLSSLLIGSVWAAALSTALGRRSRRWAVKASLRAEDRHWPSPVWIDLAPTLAQSADRRRSLRRNRLGLADQIERLGRHMQTGAESHPIPSVRQDNWPEQWPSEPSGQQANQQRANQQRAELQLYAQRPGEQLINPDPAQPTELTRALANELIRQPAVQAFSLRERSSAALRLSSPDETVASGLEA